MDVAIMKQIVRQKDLQLRGAVHDIIDNRIDAALQRIETQPADRVARSASASLPGSAIQETETPVNDIVADWTDRTPEARSRTLIITQLNADRRAVNAGIHAVLAARGELGEKAITVPVWWLNAAIVTRTCWPLTATAVRSRYAMRRGRLDCIPRRNSSPATCSCFAAARGKSVPAIC